MAGGVSDSICGVIVVRTGLSGGVEAQHQQAHLLGSEDLGHHLGY